MWYQGMDNSSERKLYFFDQVVLATYALVISLHHNNSGFLPYLYISYCRVFKENNIFVEYSMHFCFMFALLNFLSFS